MQQLVANLILKDVFVILLDLKRMDTEHIKCGLREYIKRKNKNLVKLPKDEHGLIKGCKAFL